MINLVASADLGARVDLARFSSQHRDSANFDKHVFVGLPWRAPHESCCAELYSTGRMNLPGARRERDLINSYANMAPEMLRLSDQPHRIDDFPKHLHGVHRPKEHVKSVVEKKMVIESMWTALEDEDEDETRKSLEIARSKISGMATAGTATGKRRHDVGGFISLGKRKAKPAAQPVAEPLELDIEAEMADFDALEGDDDIFSKLFD